MSGVVKDEKYALYEVNCYGFINLPDGSTQPADSGNPGHARPPVGWCVWVLGWPYGAVNVEDATELFDETYATKELAEVAAKRLAESLDCEISRY